MKDRLNKILVSEGITPTILATELGVQRSGISHILTGRNFPSFDFLQKLLMRYPKLSAEWLLLGNGSMYKSNTNTNISSNATEVPVRNLFESNSAKEKTPLSPTLPDKPQKISSQEDDKKSVIEHQPEISPPDDTKKTIEKIIVLYDNKTFGQYLPE